MYQHYSGMTAWYPRKSGKSRKLVRQFCAYGGVTEEEALKGITFLSRQRRLFAEYKEREQKRKERKSKTVGPSAEGRSQS